MFSSSHSDRFDDDWFQDHEEFISYHPPVMEIVVSLGVVIGVIVLVALCCKCCCGSRSKGRVLQPPPDPALGVGVGPPVAYPQQQYSTVTVPTGVIVGNVSAYPTSPYPVGASYPTAAAYGGGAPYPAVAPYPTGPAAAGAGMPQPASQPSAPDHHGSDGRQEALHRRTCPVLWAGPSGPAPGWHPQALPPTYDQVMSTEMKHATPYNPYA